MKGRYREVTQRRREVKDEARIQAEFLRALAEGRVDMPCVKHNADVKKALESLRTRSGGMVSVPDIKTFYEGKLGGAKSRREATYINDFLQLDAHEFCPPELKAEIDQKFPESVEAAGHRLAVSYEHRPASPQSYYESERAEKFSATITIPGDILFKLNEGDIPAIGENGRPSISYRSGDGYNAITGTDLETLKAAVDKKRLDDAWYRFHQPESREVEAVLLQPLPTPDALGLKPVAYAKDYQGNDVLAHPGYRVEQTYDYDKSAYVYKYRTEYFQNEASAKEATERALQYKTQSDAQEQRRRDRETLLAPAKARYEALKPMMDRLYDERSSYGLSSDDYYALSNKWSEAYNAIYSSDADPRKAGEIMDELDRALSGGKAERERRLAMVVEVKKELDAMASKVEKIDYSSYARYGLTYDQYNTISSKWREATEALKDKDYYGSSRMPDPEKARALMREVEAMIPGEIEFTPEQEALMNVLSGRDAGFAKLVRIRGGKVAEYASPTSPNDVTPSPTEIPIGGSGRALRVRGNKLTFVYGSGNAGGSFVLGDGDYVFGRDASTALRVEPKEKAPYGLRAIEFVSQSGYEEEEREAPRSSRRYEEAPVVSSSETPSGFGGLGTALKNFLGGKPKEQPTPPVETPAPVARQEAPKPVEREKMTEEIRSELSDILRNARIFLDTVRAVPEPTDKKTSNAEKISKARTKAADAKKDLNSIESELATIDDAPRARGRVGDIARRAERLAEDMARLRNEREDWTGQFKTINARMVEIATAQGVEIDEKLQGILRPKLIDLAKQKGEIADLGEELESILIDSI